MHLVLLPMQRLLTTTRRNFVSHFGTRITRWESSIRAFSSYEKPWIRLPPWSSCVDAKNGDKIAYVTDLEGSLQSWKRLLASSEAFEPLDGTEEKIEGGVPVPRLRPGWRFVYGGDVCDHHGSDLALLHIFVALKKAYPTHVHLIAGNRDVNKLRLSTALHPSVLASPPEVYWLYTQQQCASGKAVTLNSASSKLKWMLDHTMGSSKAFEGRRSYIASLRGVPIDEIDDDTVTESFQQQMDPMNGALAQYLSYSDLAVLIGDCLFVHGAIQKFNLGWVPGPKDLNGPLLSGEWVKDAREWVNRINEFARSEMDDYRENCKEQLKQFNPADCWDARGGYNSPTVGSRLIQYGMAGLYDYSKGDIPTRIVNPTVVYASYLDRQSVVAFPGDEVIDWLLEAGIRRVIVGHQPNGDAPFVFDKGGVQFICADTTYSASTRYCRSDLEAALHHVDGFVSMHTFPDAAMDDVGERAQAEQYLTFRTHLQENGLPQESSCTRGDRVLTHVNVRFVPKEQENDTLHSEVELRGSLVTGLKYQVLLRNDGTDVVGQVTQDGWSVKLTDLDISGVPHALLARSEPQHQFKARFVPMKNLSSLNLSHVSYGSAPETETI